MNKIKFFACFTLAAAVLSVGACSQQSQVASDAKPVKNTQVIREDVTPHVLVAIAAPESDPEPEPAGEPEPVDIDALANAVIHGDYGVGEERRAALGDNYDAVQARVNELMPVVVPVQSAPQSAPVESAPVKTAPQSAPVESAPVKAAPRSYTFEDVYNLAVNSPYCELEDGSDLPQCYWHDGAGDGSEPPYTDIVYMPDGYGYQAHEDTMTVSVFARNPWL